jgi:hypothetical protein
LTVLVPCSAALLAFSAAGAAAAVSPDARPIVGAVVGAALAAGVVYAGVQAKQKRDGAAVIDLYNYIVEVRLHLPRRSSFFRVSRVCFLLP